MSSAGLHDSTSRANPGSHPPYMGPDAHDAVLRAIDRLRDGHPILLRDDDAGAGHIVTTAAACNAATVNFMASRARGIVCLALTTDRCDQLGLWKMGAETVDGTAAPFTVSIEAREGVTTGISAADRARTIEAASAEDADAHDVTVPGHIFPLRARAGGVLERARAAEAAIDLARLGGAEPAAAMCVVLDEDGEVADADRLEAFASESGLPCVSIDQIVAYRTDRDPGLGDGSPIAVPGDHGDVSAVLHGEQRTGRRHLSLVRGDVASGDAVLRVRRRHPLDALLGRTSADPDLVGVLNRPADDDLSVLLIVESDDVDPAADLSPRDSAVAGQLLDRLDLDALTPADDDRLAATILQRRRRRPRHPSRS